MLCKGCTGGRTTGGGQLLGLDHGAGRAAEQLGQVLGHGQLLGRPQAQAARGALEAAVAQGPFSEEVVLVLVLARLWLHLPGPV